VRDCAGAACRKQLVKRGESVAGPRLQRAAEGLVQKGFFQLVQRGEFALIEGFEVLGFGA
jgi:hypothetical protein